MLLSDMLHLSRSLFFIFQLLGECHCRWTNESPRAHVAKFYGQLLLIRSVLRVSKFCGFITSSLLASTVFGTFGTSLSQFWNYVVWLRMTDEGLVPEMCILSILFIKSDLKWCIYLSRSLVFILYNENRHQNRIDSVNRVNLSKLRLFSNYFYLFIYLFIYFFIYLFIYLYINLRVPFFTPRFRAVLTRVLNAVPLSPTP